MPDACQRFLLLRELLHEPRIVLGILQDLDDYQLGQQLLVARTVNLAKRSGGQAHFELVTAGEYGAGEVARGLCKRFVRAHRARFVVLVVWWPRRSEERRVGKECRSRWA